MERLSAKALHPPTIPTLVPTLNRVNQHACSMCIHILSPVLLEERKQIIQITPVNGVFCCGMLVKNIRGESGVKQQWEEWFRGCSAAVPIMVGYLPVAVTFGVIAQQMGIPALQTTLMSILVYAGASQFMAVNMLATGAGGLEVVTATFVLNFRHFVMGLSLMNLFRGFPSRWKLAIASGMTDETFAMASIRAGSEPKMSPRSVAGMMLGAYSSWILGSLAGHLLSQVIPPTISESMSIALYAMFIGLLVPTVRKEWRAGAVALSSMLLCWGFSQVLDEGWAIVLATVLGGGLGSFWMKEETS